MKANLIMAIITSMLIATFSCKSKSQRDAEKHMSEIQKTMKENSPPEAEDQVANLESPQIPQGMESIIGDWELVKVAPDDNGDHVLDPQEDAKGTSNLKDLLILNSDGSCEYTIARMKGRYKIETKDDGKKKLVMYDRTGSEVNRGRYIVSVTSTDLVINRLMGGSDFEIFKRL